ncbi:unnamed protein product [Symbiodinium sp. CCMP2592]|nr:unnamed protein product [Symbiodinium sp. CCMP2592]
MSKRSSGHHHENGEHHWRTIFSVALENTWCPDLQEAIEKLPMEDDDRQLLCDQLNFFNQDLLLSVLKRGSTALRAYHEEHPEYLSVIYSVSLGQPNVFELINQRLLVFSDDRGILRKVDVVGQGKRTIDLSKEAAKIQVPDGDEGLSPAKSRKAEGGAGITAAELQRMLGQQTDQLARAQTAAVDSAVSRFEKIVDDKVSVATQRVDGLEAKLEALEKRLDEMHAGGAPGKVSSVGDDLSRRQRTLVFGGWNRDTRRVDLLSELKDGLESLGVAPMMDEPPFTTGARRSMALAAFRERANESFAAMRSRMQAVVRAFAEANVQGRQGKKLWCNWSKTRLERAHSSHAAWIKKVVAGVDSDKLVDVEIEWNQGNVWGPISLMGSSALPIPPGTDMREVIIRDDLETKAWVSWGLIARELKLDPKVATYEGEVEDHFKARPRDPTMVIFEGDLNAGYAGEADLDFIPVQEGQRANAGWDVEFAVCQQGDPHEAIHSHLAGVYSGSSPDTSKYKYQGDFFPFTVEELRDGVSRMKAGKAVGTDLTSQELLVGVLQLEGGEEHILRWYNKVLGSQCVDLAKAFDCVDRGMLLGKLSERLGPCAELGCWAALLGEITGTLQTPWGLTLLSMPSGIKQGAVESPSFFAFIAEVALSETAAKHGWGRREKLLEGMNHEECMFMDDTILWGAGCRAVQTRLQELSRHLRTFGLMVNIAKCQLYCGPQCTGVQRVSIDGVALEPSPHLDVMGVQFKVGATMMEMISPLATQARGKFWEIKHVLRAKGNLYKRIRTMQRTVAASALWCASAFAPDRSAMGFLNSVQMQLVVWMMRLSKGSHEDWGAYRKRVWRAARAAIHRSGEERWSTIWLRRYWGFAGHRARGLEGDSPVISALFEGFRTKKWWDKEKLDPNGIKHPHHFARLMQMEGHLNRAAGGDWREVARDRARWREREAEWVRAQDLPWASGRQDLRSILPAEHGVRTPPVLPVLWHDSAHDDGGVRELTALIPLPYTIRDYHAKEHGPVEAPASLDLRPDPAHDEGGVRELKALTPLPYAIRDYHAEEQGAVDTEGSCFMQRGAPGEPSSSGQERDVSTMRRGNDESTLPGRAYVHVLQMLGGERDQPPWNEVATMGGAPDDAELAIRRRATDAICRWEQSSTSQLSRLQTGDQGRVQVWRSILARVVDRLDPRYSEFARIYLRWLRDYIGGTFNSQGSQQMSVAEVQLAMQIEEATYQDFQQAMEGMANPGTMVRVDMRARRVQMTELRRGLGDEFRRLQASSPQWGLQAELHHQLACKGDVRFACFAVTHLGDVYGELPAVHGRDRRPPGGRQWAKWVVMGFWNHYCQELAASAPMGGHGHTDRPRATSRSRSPVNRGRDEPASSDSGGLSDETSLVSLPMFAATLLQFAVVSGFDRPFFRGHEPYWYTEIVRKAVLLIENGADWHSLSTRLEEQLRSKGDVRFTEETLLYVNGISMCLSEYIDGGGGPGMGPHMLVEADVVTWLEESIAAIRRHWFWLLCPVAVANRDLERVLEQTQHPTRTLNGMLYEDEDSEAENSRLSRSRTPQRDDVRLRLGLRQHRRTPRRDRAEGEEGEEGSLMDTGDRKYNKGPRTGEHGRGDRRRRLEPSRPWNRHRDRSRTPERKPKAKARPATAQKERCTVTTSTRRLVTDRPALPRPGQPGSSTDVPAIRRLEEDQAVDAWRFLLNLDSESFVGDVDVVAAEQPLLPPTVANMVEETMAGYSDHDRAVMTVAFVRFLRMLMSEVMQCFERGVRAGEAGLRGEVLVEVRTEEEEGDGNSLMQRTVTGIFAGGQGPVHRWHVLLQRLQAELHSMAAGDRQANIEGLRNRLSGAPDVDPARGDQLQAVLVAMSDAEDNMVGVGDLTWQLAWWRNLFGTPLSEGMPGSSTDIPVLDEQDLARLAEDQEEARREREAETRKRDLEQRGYEEFEDGYHRYQEALQDDDQTKLRRLSAQEHKQWEDWQWRNIMQEPNQKRRRHVLTVTVSGQVDSHSGWLSRTLQLPLQGSGPTSLRLDLAVNSETCPDEVETVVLNEGRSENAMPAPAPDATVVHEAGASTTSLGGESESVGAEGQHMVNIAGPLTIPPDQQSTLPYETQLEDGTMRDLAFQDYEKLYKEWKEGRLSDADIRVAGGPGLLDLMQSQRLLDYEDETQVQQMENLDRVTAPQNHLSDTYVDFPEEPEAIPITPNVHMMDRALEGIQTSDEE